MSSADPDSRNYYAKHKAWNAFITAGFRACFVFAILIMLTPYVMYTLGVPPMLAAPILIAWIAFCCGLAVKVGDYYARRLGL